MAIRHIAFLTPGNHAEADPATIDFSHARIERLRDNVWGDTLGSESDWMRDGCSRGGSAYTRADLFLCTAPSWLAVAVCAAPHQHIAANSTAMQPLAVPSG